jgi:pilus assembly protein CpaF
MNTGHDGSMGTLHANSPREALSAYGAMITMGGFALPPKTIREMIVSSIDVVVQASVSATVRAASPTSPRCSGMEGDVIITQDIFVYDIEGEDADGKVIGTHRSTGIGPVRNSGIAPATSVKTNVWRSA